MLAAVFALLVIVVIANAAVVCLRALRAGGVTASAEAAYVESRIVAPSGLIPTAQERRQLELAGSPRRGEDGSR